DGGKGRTSAEVTVRSRSNENIRASRDIPIAARDCGHPSVAVPATRPGSVDSMAQFELLIAMLFAIIALHYVGRRLHLPPAVALIVGGASLTLIPGLPVISLDPELVLAIFLPPLIMDGAWFIPLRQLKS